MISRDDMLELTRRMTPSRTCFSRIAGCYLDEEGYVDGTFNTHFLKLPAGEKETMLEIAKTVPFAKTNVQLKDYEFPKESRRPGSFYHLLNALKECGLKNDALMDTLYEVVSERYSAPEKKAILLFFGRYDVPVKGSDKVEQWESEEVYEFMICAVCPWSGDYEVGRPEYGFLYPSFSNRSTFWEHAAVFDADPGHPEKVLY